MLKENILCYKVNTFYADGCVEHVFKSLQSGKRTWLACFNPHSYVLSLEDKVFARALKDADWLVPMVAAWCWHRVYWAARLKCA